MALGVALFIPIVSAAPTIAKIGVLMLGVGGVISFVYAKLGAISRGKYTSWGPAEIPGNLHKFYWAGYMLMASSFLGLLASLATGK